MKEERPSYIQKCVMVFFVSIDFFLDRNYNRKRKGGVVADEWKNKNKRCICSDRFRWHFAFCMETATEDTIGDPYRKYDDGITERKR